MFAKQLGLNRCASSSLALSANNKFDFIIQILFFLFITLQMHTIEMILCIFFAKIKIISYICEIKNL